MDLLENALFEKGLMTGVGTNIALGLGILLLGPAVASLAGSILRPVAKTVIKGGIIAYDQARSLVAETQGTAKALVSESKVELSREQPASFREAEASPAEMAAQPGRAAVYEQGSTFEEHEPERTKPWIVRGY